MARKSTPQPLSLAETKTLVHDHGTDGFLDSPRSQLSAKSQKSPRSPFKFTATKKGQQSQGQGEQSPTQIADSQENRTTNLLPSQTSASITISQQYPASSTAGEERQGRDRPTRSGFFTNYKASKSSSRLQSQDAGRLMITEDSVSRDTDRPPMSGKDLSKEASRSGTALFVSSLLPRCHSLTGACSPENGADKSVTRRPVGEISKSKASIALADSPAATNTVKKNKPKPFNLLGRTRSIRDEQSPREAPSNDKPLEHERANTYTSLKTAPLRGENDRSARDMMNSSVRQRSEDRQPTQPRDMPQGRDFRESGRIPTSFSTSFREGGGHAFLNNLKSSATKGAGAIHKGLFGKGSRSGSTHEKELPVDDEHYQLRVINLPLVQQTQLTRLSKSLRDSRDKTEFWMPAFPWRAIDYLNYKGSEVEGLYRVPGSGPQIKKWQRRFDEGKGVGRHLC